MPAVVAAPATPHPINTVRAAVAWARGRGLQITLVEDFGVVCLSSALPTWVADPRAEGPNIVGACIMRVQPHTTNIEKAAEIAMGAPMAYCEGFARGLAKLDPAHEWDGSLARRLFAAGYEAGVFARSWMLRPVVGSVPAEGQG
jgi:hypothetical protein